MDNTTPQVGQRWYWKNSESCEIAEINEITDPKSISPNYICTILQVFRGYRKVGERCVFKMGARNSFTTIAEADDRGWLYLRGQDKTIA
jgi:hypothetical protein